MRIKTTLGAALFAIIAVSLSGMATAAETMCCKTCNQASCEIYYDGCRETYCDTCPSYCPNAGCGGGRAARRAARQAAYQDCLASWYGTYAHVGWGAPVTLVVPPTAKYQTDYGWGVGNTRVGPIYPQFSRSGYGTAVYSPSAYRTTPLWPSDTSQFGVYYARGPW